MTEDFNSKDYFAHLYGAKDELGNPSQTKIDKLRDGLLVKLFNRYRYWLWLWLAFRLF